MASPNTSTQFDQTLPMALSWGSAEYWQNKGVITQALGSISQAGTASYPLQEVLRSTVQSSTNAFQFVELTLTSYLVPVDQYSVITTDLLTSTANAVSTPTFDVFTYLTSVVNPSESFETTQTTLLSSEGAKAEDTWAQSVTWLETSVVQLQSSFEFGREYSLTDTVNVITSIVTPGITYNQLIYSTINVSDALITGQEQLVTSNTNVTDTYTHSNVPTEFLISVADMTSDLTSWGTLVESLISTAQTSHAFDFSGSTYNNTLLSTANVTDTFWAKDFGAIAWVMNTQSGGLTSYNNFGFTSLAFHNGKLYATSPEGLFEMGADDDDGRHISSYSKSGFLDFGSEEKKRLSDIYIGYTGGDLECDVETYDGPKDVYTYEMEHRDADAPRNSRIKPGRGLSSRYWRFTFRNTNGADYQIYDVAVQTAKSIRRL